MPLMLMRKVLQGLHMLPMLVSLSCLCLSVMPYDKPYYMNSVVSEHPLAQSICCHIDLSCSWWGQCFIEAGGLQCCLLGHKLPLKQLTHVLIWGLNRSGVRDSTYIAFFL
ncbi:hypothetical protein GDO81_005700 [Engystomops pustulosus]|uniref:Secreted protein n=1 Tax=Engystomops pustulosus TaxID=76066 RepID=A0AAV7CSP2_ENGPU|nr:hypothetical protein GDO81_005700 [Engystomops pustulosus]